MTASGSDTRDAVAAAIATQPFAQLLGLSVDRLEHGHAVLRLPYREVVTTVGETVHGGAIAGLVDTAATAAAWLTLERVEGARGTTIGFTVDYLTALAASDGVADARVVRSGGSIVTVAVDVRDEGGGHCATALVTYKLDRPKPSGGPSAG